MLFRVDERLIHGQVVIGWGHELRPNRYFVVDDDLAESDWEQELYRLGADGVEVVFSSRVEASDALGAYLGDASRTILLTRDVVTMRALVEGGEMTGRTVNVGGIHPGPGRVKVLNYLHLSPADVDDVRRIVAAGVRVQARDLPDAPRVDLADALGLQ